VSKQEKRETEIWTHIFSTMAEEQLTKEELQIRNVKTKRSESRRSEERSMLKKEMDFVVLLLEQSKVKK
jgi:hypothetical protein